MKSKNPWLALLLVATLLQSCEFSCSVGNKPDKVEGKAVVQNGARLYNDITATATTLKLSRAYLQFKNGDPVPEGNLTDFTQPVVLHLEIDGGWKVDNGKVAIGAGEKLVAEDGTVLLNEADLFEGDKGNNISESDARFIQLTARFNTKENTRPKVFTVYFRVWDKNGDGVIEGSYKLYSN